MTRVRRPELPTFPEILRGDHWQPPVDVLETEDALVVRAELAGVAAEAVRVSVDGEWLQIQGERPALSGDDVQRLHRMEIPSGPFVRRLRITIPIDRDAVVARLADGLLQVLLPKKRPARRRIQVRQEE